MAPEEKEGDDLTVNLSWPGSVDGLPPPPSLSPPPPGRPPRVLEADPQPPQNLQGLRPPAAPPLPLAAERAPAPPGPASALRRLRAKDSPPASVPGQGNETLLNILEHLSTLSRLVTGTSKASTTELKALGSRVDKAVGELEALQLRVLRSLAGFDSLRLRVQKEMADRRELTDDEVDRIADAVTQRLLAHVRVETEDGQR